MSDLNFEMFTLKPGIIELVFIAILVICAWNGYKKGLIMGIGGVLAIVVALYGANLLSSTFSYEVIPALRPFAAGYLDSKAETELYGLLGYEPDENGDYHVLYSAEDLLAQQPELRERVCAETYESIGIYSDAAEVMAEEAVDYASDNGVFLFDAITEVACLRLTWAVGLVLAFLLIYIAIVVIGNIPNFSFKIPYMGLFNDITGTVTGLITGFLLCALLIWALRFAGLVAPQSAVEETHLAAWFLEKNFLLRFLSL